LLNDFCFYLFVTEFSLYRASCQNTRYCEASPKAVQQPIVTGEGWKSLANWRKLKQGMSEHDVRALLGEPVRICGGDVALWEYPDYGKVRFYGREGVDG